MIPAFAPAAVAARLPTADQEFALTAADFERVRSLIYQRAGISLSAGKQAMVYSRVSRRLRETGKVSFADYLAWLEQGQGASADAEWQEFINCLTTNLTAFFREEHHFAALHNDLRAFAAARAGAHPPLRLWCSAASTGEEPYSMAMTVLDALGSSAAVKILCSDIDTKVLVTAQRGVYPADSRGLTTDHLKHYFLRGKGSNLGHIRVKPELARLVEFRPFNLMNTHWNSLGAPFDMIFCRNVMIYFDGPTQRQVLQRMHATLKPGGLLYVGHSENFSESRELFRLRGKTIYERV
jgi:chemotaxis protein methyltransferase CheR